MSLFSKILNKLGIKKDVSEETAAPKGKANVKKGPSEAPRRPVADRPLHRASGSAAVPMVDVTSKLETMAKGTKLDWKVSIVDLLKVLGIESSLEARKELAQELGCPPDLMGGDSAKMNVWLHKRVLSKIAANGGNIPRELLD